MSKRFAGRGGIVVVSCIAAGLIWFFGSGIPMGWVGEWLAWLDRATAKTVVIRRGAGPRTRMEKLLADPIARMRAGIAIEPGVYEIEHAPGFVGPPSVAGGPLMTSPSAP